MSNIAVSTLAMKTAMVGLENLGAAQAFGMGQAFDLRSLHMERSRQRSWSWPASEAGMGQAGAAFTFLPVGPGRAPSSTATGAKPSLLV